MSIASSTILLMICLYFVNDIMASKRFKRYLAFPKGTSFTVTVAMSTFLPKDVIPKKIPTGLAHILEYDFTYKLPDHLIMNPTPVSSPNPKNKKKVPVWIDSPPSESELYLPFPDRRKWKTKRRGRLLDQLSYVIDRHGYDGSTCLERLECEAHQNLSWGRSLIEDVVLGTVPPPKSSEYCQRQWNKECPISILQILLHSEPVDE